MFFFKFRTRFMKVLLIYTLRIMMQHLKLLIVERFKFSIVYSMGSKKWTKKRSLFRIQRKLLIYLSVFWCWKTKNFLGWMGKRLPKADKNWLISLTAKIQMLVSIHLILLKDSRTPILVYSKDLKKKRVHTYEFVTKLK